MSGGRHPRIGKAWSGAAAASVYRGETHFNNDTSSTTSSSTSTLSIQSGDLVVAMFAAVDNNGEAPSGATCGAQAMTLVKSVYSDADNYRIDLFALVNASANAAATITATYATARTFRALAAAHFGGVATASATKESSCNAAACDALAASSTSRTAQNISTSVADCLLIACGVDWNGGLTHTEQNGFTLRVNGTTPFLLHKDVNATGSYPNGNFSTVNTSDQYMAIFAAFALA